MRRSTLGTVYSLLLRAYPRKYRERFGASMLADFEDRAAEVRTRGTLSLALLLGATVFDVARLAPLERFRARALRGSDRKKNARYPSSGSSLSKYAGSVRVALRMVVKTPLSSVVAMVTIAFGIALTATTFSIVYGSTMRGLPFESPDELVHFERQNLSRGLPNMAVTPHDYVAWKTQQSSFEDIAAFVEAYILIRDGDHAPRPEAGVRIDEEAFHLLRVQPALGRLFTRDENRPGGPRVILLSHGLWQSRYGGDSTVIGRSIRVTRQTTALHTVIGVMPEGFGFPIAERFWLPLRLDLAGVERGDGRLDVFGRLRPGVGLADAQREFGLISDRLASSFPGSNTGVQATLSTFQEEYVGEDFASRVHLMFAGSLFVLLIACANVSNLLMARTNGRKKELAVRTALGASWRSVALLVATEAAILAFAGGIIGIGLAFAGVRWFGSALLGAGALRLPHGGDALFWWQFKLDLVPALFAFALTAICAVVAGLVPAVLAARTDVATLLKEEGRNSGSPRLRLYGQVLVTLEVAVAAALLTATALTMKSLVKLQTLDVGFPQDEIVVARVGLYGEEYADNAARRLRFWNDLLVSARSIPGVTDVALGSRLPMLRHRPMEVSVPGRVVTDGSRELAGYATVTPQFFATYNLMPVEGRLFTDLESTTQANVVVVNESFAGRFFGDADPVGRTVRLGRDDDGVVRTVVGVVPDSWMDGERNRRPEGLFLPLGSRTPLNLYLSIRSHTALVDIAGQVSAVAARVDPEQPIYDVQTMRQLIEGRTGRFNIYGTFYVVFGIVALAMSVIGLYGVISFNVGQRTNEIGIRMALGADRGNVVSSVLRLGLKHVLVGLTFGAGLAYWISLGLDSVLFEVDTWDVPLFLMVSAVLGGTSVLACLLPARRAAGISPVAVLRDA